MHPVPGEFPPRPHRTAPWPSVDDVVLDAWLTASLWFGAALVCIGAAGLAAIAAGWMAP